MQPLAVLRKQQPPAVESCRVDRAGRNSGSRSPKSINTHHHRPMLPRSFFCDVGASFRRLLARRIDSIARGPRRFSTCSPVPADAAAVDADAPVVAAPPHSLVCGVDEAGRGAVVRRHPLHYIFTPTRTASFQYCSNAFVSLIARSSVHWSLARACSVRHRRLCSRAPAFATRRNCRPARASASRPSFEVRWRIYNQSLSVDYT